MSQLAQQQQYQSLQSRFLQVEQAALQRDLQTEERYDTFQVCRTGSGKDVLADVFIVINALIVIRYNLQCFFWWRNSKKPSKPWIVVLLFISTIIVIAACVFRWVSITIRAMVLLMMASQYFFLCALSILLLLIAPSYQEDQQEYVRKSKFILAPLHFLHVWVTVVAILTSYGGFCKEDRMYPAVVYLANGLFLVVFVAVVILGAIKYKVDISIDQKDPGQRPKRAKSLRSASVTFTARTVRLTYFSVWCVILTLAFLVATTIVFHSNTDNYIKCSKDGEHFLFKGRVHEGASTDCYYSALVYFLWSLTTIHSAAVIRVVFFRNVTNAQDVLMKGKDPDYSSDNEEIERIRAQSPSRPVNDGNLETEAGLVEHDEALGGLDLTDQSKGDFDEENSIRQKPVRARDDDDHNIATDRPLMGQQGDPVDLKIPSPSFDSSRKAKTKNQVSFGGDLVRAEPPRNEEKRKVAGGKGDPIRAPAAKHTGETVQDPGNHVPSQQKSGRDNANQKTTNETRKQGRPDFDANVGKYEEAEVGALKQERKEPSLPPGQDQDSDPMHLRRCARLFPDEQAGGSRPECCQSGLFYLDDDVREGVVPLQGIETVVTLQGAIAKMVVNLTYVNLSQNNPIEGAYYQFPVEPSTILENLSVKIGNTVIDSRVQAKGDKAECQEDAPEGNMAAATEKKEILTVTLGDLQPDQKAIISLELVHIMELEGNAFKFVLPQAFYPDYQKHSTFNNRALAEKHPYTFKLDISIESSKAITYLSKPLNSIATPFPPRNNKVGRVNLTCTEPSELIRLYYRCADMLERPELLFAKSPDYPEEVAWSVAFVPAFEQTTSSNKMQIVQDVKPAVRPPPPESLHFMFLVDRSSTMKSPRIDTAKSVLHTLLARLPPSSKFTIIGFGKNNKIDKDAVEVNAASLGEAQTSIEAYKANLGTKNILSVLQMVFDSNAHKGMFNRKSNEAERLKRKIFILTDGEIEDKTHQDVIKLIEKQQDTSLHTFGIGPDCNTTVVEDIAKRGGGRCTLFAQEEGEYGHEEKVATAVSMATEPCPRRCFIGSDHTSEGLNSVFRQQLVHRHYISSTRDFAELTFRLVCDKDSTTKKPIDLKFHYDQFREVSDTDMASALFKLAGSQQIEALRKTEIPANPLRGNFTQIKEERVNLSLKYQVLTNDTAMVGIVKQRLNSQAELTEVKTIQFQSDHLSKQSDYQSRRKLRPKTNEIPASMMGNLPEKQKDKRQGEISQAGHMNLPAMPSLMAQASTKLGIRRVEDKSPLQIISQAPSLKPTTQESAATPRIPLSQVGSGSRYQETSLSRSGDFSLEDAANLAEGERGPAVTVSDLGLSTGLAGEDPLLPFEQPSTHPSHEQPSIAASPLRPDFEREIDNIPPIKPVHEDIGAEESIHVKFTASTVLAEQEKQIKNNQPIVQTEPLTIDLLDDAYEQSNNTVASPLQQKNPLFAIDTENSDKTLSTQMKGEGSPDPQVGAYKSKWAEHMAKVSANKRHQQTQPPVQNEYSAGGANEASWRKQGEPARYNNLAKAAVFQEEQSYYVPSSVKQKPRPRQQTYSPTPLKPPTKFATHHSPPQPRSHSPRRTKPFLLELTSLQNNDSGLWGTSAETTLKKFFTARDFMDKAVHDEMIQCLSGKRLKYSPAVKTGGYGEKKKRHDLYLTLVALYVLENEFNDRGAEWGFAAGRAIKKLKESGIDDPEALIKKFKLKMGK